MNSAFRVVQSFCCNIKAVNQKGVDDPIFRVVQSFCLVFNSLCSGRPTLILGEVSLENTDSPCIVVHGVSRFHKSLESFLPNRVVQCFLANKALKSKKKVWPPRVAIGSANKWLLNVYAGPPKSK